MKVARYIGGGEIAITEEATPSCPPGGLLIRTIASGLCSGELMDWYMDRKIPHVLGHEVCGRIEHSEDTRFPVGAQVFVHHHAPCLECEVCQRGAYVHCEQWRRTKLNPGGMAEFFAVSPDNLNDTLLVDDLRPMDAALIEPLAGVVKSIRRADLRPDDRVAVIGLGVMGLMHALLARAQTPDVVSYDLNDSRRRWAESVGVPTQAPEDAIPADVIFVCPGTAPALALAVQIAAADARIILFSPFRPGEEPVVSLNDLYFRDLQLITSYSCGPDDTRAAYEHLQNGDVKAEQVVSDFIEIDELPSAYQEMKRAEILKPMVIFGSPNATK